MPKFEVAIHNEEVRNCVRTGRKHRSLSPDWADTHYIEVEAPSDSRARVIVAQRYPSSAGYVIEDVIPIRFVE